MGGCATSSDCCGTGAAEESLGAVAKALGYSDQELEGIPEGANLGLGCGNPNLLASLKPGEVVIDLGSGAGFDCFIAANKVGDKGRVIGVDMTPEMLSRARKNAADGKFTNVDFRLGEIEYLPVADGTVDVIMSNCVINLSPDKGQVFKDCFRVLVPGGRLSVSDVVATADLPKEILEDKKLLSGCISGAASIRELETWLRDAGFEQIEIKPWDESREFIADWAPGRKVEDFVTSAFISARKPGAQSCC